MSDLLNKAHLSCNNHMETATLVFSGASSLLCQVCFNGRLRVRLRIPVRGGSVVATAGSSDATAAARDLVGLSSKALSNGGVLITAVDTRSCVVHAWHLPSSAVSAAAASAASLARHGAAQLRLSDQLQHTRLAVPAPGADRQLLALTDVLGRHVRATAVTAASGDCLPADGLSMLAAFSSGHVALLRVSCTDGSGAAARGGSCGFSVQLLALSEYSLAAGLMPPARRSRPTDTAAAAPAAEGAAHRSSSGAAVSEAEAEQDSADEGAVHAPPASRRQRTDTAGAGSSTATSRGAETGAAAPAPLAHTPAPARRAGFAGADSAARDAEAEPGSVLSRVGGALWSVMQTAVKSLRGGGAAGLDVHASPGSAYDSDLDVSRASSVTASTEAASASRTRPAGDADADDDLASPHASALLQPLRFDGATPAAATPAASARILDDSTLADAATAAAPALGGGASTMLRSAARGAGGSSGGSSSGSVPVSVSLQLVRAAGGSTAAAIAVAAVLTSDGTVHVLTGTLPPGSGSATGTSATGAAAGAGAGAASTSGAGLAGGRYGQALPAATPLSLRWSTPAGKLPGLPRYAGSSSASSSSTAAATAAAAAAAAGSATPGGGSAGSGPGSGAGAPRMLLGRLFLLPGSCDASGACDVVLSCLLLPPASASASTAGADAAASGAAHASADLLSMAASALPFSVAFSLRASAGASSSLAIAASAPVLGPAAGAAGAASASAGAAGASALPLSAEARHARWTLAQNDALLVAVAPALPAAGSPTPRFLGLWAPASQLAAPFTGGTGAAPVSGAGSASTAGLASASALVREAALLPGTDAARDLALALCSYAPAASIGGEAAFSIAGASSSAVLLPLLPTLARGGGGGGGAAGQLHSAHASAVATAAAAGLARMRALVGPGFAAAIAAPSRAGAASLTALVPPALLHPSALHVIMRSLVARQQAEAALQAEWMQEKQAEAGDAGVTGNSPSASPSASPTSQKGAGGSARGSAGALTGAFRRLGFASPGATVPARGAGADTEVGRLAAATAAAAAAADARALSQLRRLVDAHSLASAAFAAFAAHHAPLVFDTSAFSTRALAAAADALHAAASAQQGTNAVDASTADSSGCRLAAAVRLLRAIAALAAARYAQANAAAASAQRRLNAAVGRGGSRWPGTGSTAGAGGFGNDSPLATPAGEWEARLLALAQAWASAYAALVHAAATEAAAGAAAAAGSSSGVGGDHDDHDDATGDDADDAVFVDTASCRSELLPAGTQRLPLSLLPVAGSGASAVVSAGGSLLWHAAAAAPTTAPLVSLSRGDVRVLPAAADGSIRALIAAAASPSASDLGLATAAAVAGAAAPIAGGAAAMHAANVGFGVGIGQLDGAPLPADEDAPALQLPLDASPLQAGQLQRCTPGAAAALLFACHWERSIAARAAHVLSLSPAAPDAPPLAIARAATVRGRAFAFARGWLDAPLLAALRPGADAIARAALASQGAGAATAEAAAAWAASLLFRLLPQSLQAAITCASRSVSSAVPAAAGSSLHTRLQQQLLQAALGGHDASSSSGTLGADLLHPLLPSRRGGRARPAAAGAGASSSGMAQDADHHDRDASGDGSGNGSDVYSGSGSDSDGDSDSDGNADADAPEFTRGRLAGLLHFAGRHFVDLLAESVALASGPLTPRDASGASAAGAGAGAGSVAGPGGSISGGTGLGAGAGAGASGFAFDFGIGSDALSAQPDAYFTGPGAAATTAAARNAFDDLVATHDARAQCLRESGLLALPTQAQLQQHSSSSSPSASSSSSAAGPASVRQYRQAEASAWCETVAALLAAPELTAALLSSGPGAAAAVEALARAPLPATAAAPAAVSDVSPLLQALGPRAGPLAAVALAAAAAALQLGGAATATPTRCAAAALSAAVTVGSANDASSLAVLADAASAADAAAHACFLEAVTSSHGGRSLLLATAPAAAVIATPALRLSSLPALLSRSSALSLITALSPSDQDSSTAAASAALTALQRAASHAGAPLWRLVADDFSAAAADATGPGPAAADAPASASASRVLAALAAGASFRDILAAAAALPVPSASDATASTVLHTLLAHRAWAGVSAWSEWHLATALAHLPAKRCSSGRLSHGGEGASAAALCASIAGFARLGWAAHVSLAAQALASGSSAGSGRSVSLAAEIARVFVSGDAAAAAVAAAGAGGSAFVHADSGAHVEGPSDAVPEYSEEPVGALYVPLDRAAVGILLGCAPPSAAARFLAFNSRGSSSSSSASSSSVSSSTAAPNGGSGITSSESAVALRESVTAAVLPFVGGAFAVSSSSSGIAAGGGMALGQLPILTCLPGSLHELYRSGPDAADAGSVADQAAASEASARAEQAAAHLSTATALARLAVSAALSSGAGSGSTSGHASAGPLSLVHGPAAALAELCGFAYALEDSGLLLEAPAGDATVNASSAGLQMALPWYLAAAQAASRVRLALAAAAATPGSNITFSSSASTIGPPPSTVAVLDLEASLLGTVFRAALHQVAAPAPAAAGAQLPLSSLAFTATAPRAPAAAGRTPVALDRLRGAATPGTARSGQGQGHAHGRSPLAAAYIATPAGAAGSTSLLTPFGGGAAARPGAFAFGGFDSPFGAAGAAGAGAASASIIIAATARVLVPSANAPVAGTAAAAGDGAGDGAAAAADEIAAAAASRLASLVDRCLARVRTPDDAVACAAARLLARVSPSAGSECMAQLARSLLGGGRFHQLQRLPLRETPALLQVAEATLRERSRTAAQTLPLAPVVLASLGLPAELAPLEAAAAFARAAFADPFAAAGSAAFAAAGPAASAAAHGLALHRLLSEVADDAAGAATAAWELSTRIASEARALLALPASASAAAAPAAAFESRNLLAEADADAAAEMRGRPLAASSLHDGSDSASAVRLREAALAGSDAALAYCRVIGRLLVLAAAALDRLPAAHATIVTSGPAPPAAAVGAASPLTTAPLALLDALLSSSGGGTSGASASAPAAVHTALPALVVVSAAEVRFCAGALRGIVEAGTGMPPRCRRAFLCRALCAAPAVDAATAPGAVGVSALSRGIDVAAVLNGLVSRGSVVRAWTVATAAARSTLALHAGDATSASLNIAAAPLRLVLQRLAAAAAYADASCAAAAGGSSGDAALVRFGGSGRLGAAARWRGAAASAAGAGGLASASFECVLHETLTAGGQAPSAAGAAAEHDHDDGDDGLHDDAAAAQGATAAAAAARRADLDDHLLPPQLAAALGLGGVSGSGASRAAAAAALSSATAASGASVGLVAAAARAQAVDAVRRRLWGLLRALLATLARDVARSEAPSHAAAAASAASATTLVNPAAAPVPESLLLGAASGALDAVSDACASKTCAESVCAVDWSAAAQAERCTVVRFSFVSRLPLLRLVHAADSFMLSYPASLAVS